MEQNEKNVRSRVDYKSYRISWVGYTRSFFWMVVFFIVAITLYQVWRPLGLFFGAAGLIFELLRMLHLSTVCLYTNDDGVCLYSGLFPWNKGVRSVKWRDLEGATCNTGFGSWILKTYDIHVSHRFTKANEFSVKHLGDGADAVLHINALHGLKMSMMS